MCMFGGLSGSGYLETNLRSTEGSSPCYSYDMRTGGYERVCNIRVSSGVPSSDIKTALCAGVVGSETALKACGKSSHKIEDAKVLGFQLRAFVN